MLDGVHMTQSGNRIMVWELAGLIEQSLNYIQMEKKIK